MRGVVGGGHVAGKEEGADGEERRWNALVRVVGFPPGGGGGGGGGGVRTNSLHGLLHRPGRQLQGRDGQNGRVHVQGSIRVNDHRFDQELAVVRAGETVVFQRGLGIDVVWAQRGQSWQFYGHSGVSRLGSWGGRSDGHAVAHTGMEIGV